MMDINFVTTNPIYIDSLRDFFEGTSFVNVVKCRLEKLPLKNTLFICPCDCFCTMTDVIGRIYNEVVFPYIRVFATRKLKELETKTSLGRSFLPLGSAMVVPGDFSENCYVLFVPVTFTHGQDIRETRNIYHAFIAILCMLKRWHNRDIEKVMFPCLEEYVRPHTFAEQVYSALVDFTFLLYLPKVKYNKMDTTVYIPDYEERNKEQPEYYDNREIKTLVNVRQKFY